MFDKCVLFNLHASKPVWAGCVSSLYYIIQNIFLCSIKYTYIHTYIHIKPLYILSIWLKRFKTNQTSFHTDTHIFLICLVTYTFLC